MAGLVGAKPTGQDINGSLSTSTDQPSLHEAQNIVGKSAFGLDIWSNSTASFFLPNSTEMHAGTRPMTMHGMVPCMEWYHAWYHSIEIPQEKQENQKFTGPSGLLTFSWRLFGPALSLHDFVIRVFCTLAVWDITWTCGQCVTASALKQQVNL